MKPCLACEYPKYPNLVVASSCYCVCGFGVQGVPSGSHAKQLAEAALLELQQADVQLASAADDGAPYSPGPACVASSDALLRCCLKGQQPWPSAVLVLARALLQQHAKWAQHGFCASGGNPVWSHGVLLWFNSQLAALAGEQSHCLPACLHVWRSAVQCFQGTNKAPAV